MGYLGRQLSSGNYLKLDDISSQFNGSTTTFNLTSGGQAFYPGSAFSILVSVAGIIQEPVTSYTVDQNQITFASAPGASDNFFCIVLGLALGINVPGDGTVSGAKLTKPFNYDSGLLYLDDGNNRVGINSASPTTALDVVGNAAFSGNISVAGTITYNDVTNVDSLGIITARTGVDVNAGGVNIDAGGLNVVAGVSTFAGIATVTAHTLYTTQLSASGVVTASSYYGDGSNLTGIGGGKFSSDAAGIHTSTSIGINTSGLASNTGLTGVGNSFQGMYVSNGMILFDNTLSGNHYIGTNFSGLIAGPANVTGVLTIDGEYVVV